MIEICIYTAISPDGREAQNQMGIINHDLKIAGHKNRLKWYKYEEEDNGRFKECYQKWNEWTKNTVVIFVYE